MPRGDFSFTLASGEEPYLRLPDSALFTIYVRDGARMLAFREPFSHLTIVEGERVGKARWAQIKPQSRRSAERL